MKHEELIDNYVEAHESLWAYSTWRSTRSRLKHIRSALDLKPDALYSELKGIYQLAPYTIKTTLSIVSSYFDWLVEQGHRKGNPFLGFKKKLHRVGSQRNAYKKRIIGLTYSEASSRLDQIRNKPIREHAQFLLKSGLRISESYITQAEGENTYVIGKGSKRRRVYARAPESLVSVHELRLTLKDLGLKPHDLRKLFATKLVNEGLPLQDVCSIMGWSDIKTAMNYLQSSSEDSLSKSIQEALR